MVRLVYVVNDEKEKLVPGRETGFVLSESKLVVKFLDNTRLEFLNYIPV